MSDYENIGDEVENAIVYALEAMRDSKVWRGPMRIDGSVKEFAEDVRAYVKAADDMKEGRNVVSLGTYQAATDEIASLRDEVDTLTRHRTMLLGERKDATIATLTAERDEAREELESVLSDWNALVKTSGSLTHGAAIGVVARLRADVERLTKEARGLATDVSNLNRDNARHIETIRVLRSTSKDLCDALQADLDDVEEPTRVDAPTRYALHAARAALDASDGYEQADAVKRCDPVWFTDNPMSDKADDVKGGG